MSKLIGYLTRDEVNAAIARGTPLPDDIRICQSDTEDGLPNVPLLAMVYDLDNLWQDDQPRVLRKLSGEPPACPTGVHSYSLDDEQADHLRIMGVVVRRQVSEDLFQQLAGVGVPVRRAA